MELQGTIKKIFDLQTFPSGFQKKEMVVTTQEQYPQDILVEFLQDKVSLLDSFNVGDEVKVSINIRGREWVSPEGVAKYFNSINGWKIEKLTEKNSSNVVSEKNYDNTQEESDDLPF